MYADTVTDSMAQAIDETERRRDKQIAFNKEHNIDPQPLRKKIADLLDQVYDNDSDADQSTTDDTSTPSLGSDTALAGDNDPDYTEMTRDDLVTLRDNLTQQMADAARDLKFELAARLRDELVGVKKELKEITEAGVE